MQEAIAVNLSYVRPFLRRDGDTCSPALEVARACPMPDSRPRSRNDHHSLTWYTTRNDGDTHHHVATAREFPHKVILKSPPSRMLLSDSPPSYWHASVLRTASHTPSPHWIRGEPQASSVGGVSLCTRRRWNGQRRSDFHPPWAWVTKDRTYRKFCWVFIHMSGAVDMTMISLRQPAMEAKAREGAREHENHLCISRSLGAQAHATKKQSNIVSCSAGSSLAGGSRRGAARGPSGRPRSQRELVLPPRGRGTAWCENRKTAPVLACPVCVWFGVDAQQKKQVVVCKKPSKG